MDKVLMILEDMDRTPAWLCRQAGISHSLFTLMKNGNRGITIKTKNKISKILGIRNEILFNNEPKEK
tara:strand:+ start:1264 stop:1464 length:201 start_codon:yes stop_codon:yes gene_type:complete